MFLRNLKIGARLALGFSCILCILLLTVIVSSTLGERGKSELLAGVEAANSKIALTVSMAKALMETGIAVRNIGLNADVASMEKQQTLVKQQSVLYIKARSQLEKLSLSDADYSGSRI